MNTLKPLLLTLFCTTAFAEGPSEWVIYPHGPAQLTADQNSDEVRIDVRVHSRRTEGDGDPAADDARLDPAMSIFKPQHPSPTCYVRVPYTAVLSRAAALLLPKEIRAENPRPNMNVVFQTFDTYWPSRQELHAPERTEITLYGLGGSNQTLRGEVLELPEGDFHAFFSKTGNTVTYHWLMKGLLYGRMAHILGNGSSTNDEDFVTSLKQLNKKYKSFPADSIELFHTLTRSTIPTLDAQQARQYLDNYRDLREHLRKNAPKASEEKRVAWAKRHWENSGYFEGRSFEKKTPKASVASTPLSVVVEDTVVAVKLTSTQALQYLENYDDLYRAALGSTKAARIAWARKHFERHARKENRSYEKGRAPLNRSTTAEKADEVVSLSDAQALQYLENYADLQKAALRATAVTWANNHYNKHGLKEGRKYAPLKN